MSTLVFFLGLWKTCVHAKASEVEIYFCRALHWAQVSVGMTKSTSTGGPFPSVNFSLWKEYYDGTGTQCHHSEHYRFDFLSGYTQVCRKVFTIRLLFFLYLRTNNTVAPGTRCYHNSTFAQSHKKFNSRSSTYAIFQSIHIWKVYKIWNALHAGGRGCGFLTSKNVHL